MELQTTRLSKGEAEVLNAVLLNNGRMSQREATCNLDITSAQLAHFVQRLKEKGYKFTHLRLVNPVTGKRYTTYVLQD